MKSFLRRIFTVIFTHQAKKILKKYNVKVVVVVGSVGKTSTRQAISAILSQKYKLKFQEDNYNVPISIPFVITDQKIPTPIHNAVGWYRAWKKGQAILKKGLDYELLVLEYGIDYIGEMKLFAPICQPDYTVVSAVAPEHMEFFKSLDLVAREELSVSQFAKKLLINDQTVKRQYVEKYVAEDALVSYYGSKTDLDYQEVVKRQEDGFYHLKVLDKAGHVICACPTQMVARHSLNALTAACIVASQFGMTRSDIEKAIRSYQNPKGRMRVYRGINDSTIIDDTYNSSPVAAIAALEALAEFTAKKRIALLGNMNELGDFSAEAHKQVGRACKPDKFDLIITLGPDANRYLAPVAKIQGCRVITTDSPAQAAEIIKQELSSGSVVLAKGSQNKVYAEEAVKELLKNPKDKDNLVRQSAEWLAKKEQCFAAIS